LTLLLFVWMVGFLLTKGVVLFDMELINTSLWASIQGTLWVVVLSVGIATPLGIATGIYLESYAKGFIRWWLDISFELLASVPSIVMGLFGFSVLLLAHRVYPQLKSSLLLASISISLLILPYIVKGTQLGIRETPNIYRSIAYSLGASKESVIIHIELPFAKRHIIKGLFLSIARAAEDTAVIMLTGVVASYGKVESLFSPFEALPFYIYYTSANYENAKELDSIYVAILLLMLISSISMLIVKRASRVTKGVMQ